MSTLTSDGKRVCFAHEIAGCKECQPDSVSSKERVRPFSLWSFLRNVLHQGEAIGLDCRELPYEVYSARMDQAARERETELNEALGLSGETSEQPTQTRSRAANNVLAERNRQMAVEGWTPEHDDAYTFGELAEAAAAYLRHVSLHWPNGWDKAWYKPTTRRRDLVKSAALILAEIERLDRASMKANDQHNVTGESK